MNDGNPPGPWEIPCTPSCLHESQDCFIEIPNTSRIEVMKYFEFKLLINSENFKMNLSDAQDVKVMVQYIAPLATVKEE